MISSTPEENEAMANQKAKNFFANLKKKHPEQQPPIDPKKCKK
jgi:hypothetical protein